MVNGHCHVKIVKLYAKERTLMCMNSITKNRLIDSGWKEQRKISTDLIRKKYDGIGLEYPEVVDKFLKEYGMLNINPRDKSYFDVSFNAIEAIGCNLDGSYFKECLAEYDINETFKSGPSKEH